MLHSAIHPQSKTESEVQSRLDFLVRSSNDAITGTDINREITLWNPAAEKLYGYTEEEVLGQSIDLIVPKERKKEVLKMFKDLANGKLVSDFATKRMRKDGTIFDVAITISPIKNDFGQVIGFSTITRDITEHKKIEDLKAEFLSTAAHELRTPLTTLKLISESHLRKYKKLGKDQIKLSELNLINTELSKLNLLINDLLDDSRIETGKLYMRFAPVDLNRLIQTVVRKMKVINKNHNILYKKSKEISIIGDVSRIEQVLVNLISNAAKYSPIFSTITLRSEKLNDKIKVSVIDEGQGIPIEKQKLIFDRFYQVKEKSNKGFGLGLYISKEIVNAHKGKMWVESRVGKGSTFNFTLHLI